MGFVISNDLFVCVYFKNPDGVVVKQNSRVRAIDGVYSDTFQLTEIIK